MAQDKNSKLSARDDAEGKPEPTLSLPSGAAASDKASEPSGPAEPTLSLQPPPLPGKKNSKAAATPPTTPATRGGGMDMSKLSATSDAPSAPPEPPILAEDKAAQSTSPPTPPSLPEAPASDAHSDKLAVPADAEAPRPPRRRVARRRPAGPSRNRIAANDDGPSIGGLIYALQQKPSNTPFKFAATVSVIWAAISVAFGIVELRSDAPVLGLIDLVSRPTTFFTIAAVVLPISVLWLLALLAWRTEELRLRSSTMTEVAIRLAEPDRLAEQSAASLGQAVRRQVSFMNDAISRALGRAGELEAMVHNEVTLLERSYEDNERKIRGLIQELSGERHALVNTSDTITESLQRLGGEIPVLMDKLSDQQVKLAQIISGASENLTSLEGSLATSVGSLESAVGGRTEQLQVMLETYTSALAGALGSRAEQLQANLDDQLLQLDTSLVNRTENLQTVFEEYAIALDTALANRAQALDHHLIERTKSLDDAFAERLRMFDESIMRSTAAIDTAVVDKTYHLTSALDAHAVSFRETIGKQATDLDEALMHGINSVRRASENISRQSMKAMEGLAGQSEMLKNISENLLGQISGITGRFENQGQSIVKAANALETVNFKIDKTLQNRHADLSRTLEQLSGKASEFATFVEGYSTSIEGSLSEADIRARTELERMRVNTTAASERTLEDLRNRLSTVSSAMTSELGTMTNRFASTSEEMRRHASRAASEIAAEQGRLREQMERLPIAAQESSESMRRALQDQIKALDQLSALTARTAAQRDVTQPMGADVPPLPQRPGGGQETARSLTSLSSTIAQEMGGRQERPSRGPGGRPGPASDGREGWSLGDLLARASRDEDGAAHGGGGGGQTAFNLDLAAIARALDTATSAAIWTRLRAGQRGVMVRSIYSEQGRTLFDEVAHRCRAEPELGRTVGRYLADFERIISESDLRDPSGHTTQSHLVSDAGRVYLFLAHAYGRIA
jgi:hypothetical protein